MGTVQCAEGRPTLYYGALVETLRQTAAPKVLVDELERVVKELKESARLPQLGVTST
jgi:hypothetical protein